MKIGPITYTAAQTPTNGIGGPSHMCRIRTCVPPGVVENDHSTSIPFVIPSMWRNRIEGVSLFTVISESHHVGQLRRNRSNEAEKGLFADISTMPPASLRRSRKRTKR